MSKKEYFDYLQKRSFLGEKYRNWILYPKLSRTIKGQVLDYGCGIGDFLKYYENAIGVDINKYNIDYCNKLKLNVHLIESTQLPFDAESFKAIVMDNVLEHIPKCDVKSTLTELLRVLEPGGLIIVGVPGIKGYTSDSDHKCFYSEDDLVKLFLSFKCKKVKVIHMPTRAPWLQHFISQYCIYALFEK